ncbi:hypothetical protein [Paenibacillus chitinolyticus]|uniref:hypothetical protein n=1 Tax=Paenibacillus chitinolyticus TaxID=79263 RepID=UPI00364CA005
MTGCGRDLNLGPSGQERDGPPAGTKQSNEKSWIAAKVGRRAAKRLDETDRQPDSAAIA